MATRLLRLGRQDQFEFDSPSMFPQGGELRHNGWLSLGLSYLIGAPGVNHLIRKLEEMRLSVWIENKVPAESPSPSA